MKNQNISGQTQRVLDLIYAYGVNVELVREFVEQVSDDFDPIRVALILTGKLTQPVVNTTSEKFHYSELKSYDFYRDRVKFSHLKKRTRYFENEDDANAFAQAIYGTDEYNALIKKSSSWKTSEKVFEAEGFVEETSYCTLEEWQ